MGLSHEVFRGVIKKGYKVPTPIQRKTIPLIMDGRDVVAMARTGSGKTACFLVPLFERLKCRKAVNGARAQVLSPTRELALQTLRFAKDLGRFTGLKFECVLGGDSMEKQFAAIHENPDVLFATPGRFVHLCLEMGLRLESVEYVVFDEADRLFEMGLGEQLREILARLSDSRQTLLFSATLPKVLVDFAKAGLTDPTLVRLDVETKIPDTLKLAFLSCRADSKPAALLHLLQQVIPEDEQTLVFAATRHHVDYLQVLLDLAKVSVTYIYSNLDPAARKINAAKFSSRKGRVLVVTDLAARGIDIPLLDNVINYNFPAKSKLFVHRVGRVARAGRSGTAYSLIAGDEMAYYIDLQLFLGGKGGVVPQQAQPGLDWHSLLGVVPQAVNDDYSDQLHHWHQTSVELSNCLKVAENAYKQYLKSRSGASVESVKRAKEMKKISVGVHPVMVLDSSKIEVERMNILEQMKKFRPRSTIFEIGNTAKNKKEVEVMNIKRLKHNEVIEKATLSEELKHKDEEDENIVRKQIDDNLNKSSQEDITEAFDTVIQPKVFNPKKAFPAEPRKKKLDKTTLKDETNFIPYQSTDHHTESGYSMLTGFSAQAGQAVLDLAGDEEAELRRKKVVMKWDNKSKKYVRAGTDNQKKKIKTESGAYISATYKTNRYSKWKERSKLAQQMNDSGDEDESNAKGGKRKSSGLPANHPAMKKARNAVPQHKRGPKNEIQRPEQILKKRLAEEKKAARSKGGRGG